MDICLIIVLSSYAQSARAHLEIIIFSFVFSKLYVCMYIC